MNKQHRSTIITLLLRGAFLLILLFDVMSGLAQPRAAGAGKPPGVDTLFNCTWSNAAVAPVLLLDTPTVTVGSNLYAFGGVQGGAITAASFKFDGTTWTPIASLPAAVEFPAAVTDGTDCYILGGALTGTGTPQTTLWKYNVAANTYTTLAPFTTGTWNHSAVYLNGKIYKWCGTGPSTASAQALEIYDVASNTWTAGAPYPILISFTSGWTQGGFIYSAGGIQSVGSVASAKTYRYDPATNTWDDAAIADLPATRWGAATAFYSPDPVLAGGYVAGSVTANISNTAISWDQPSNSWQTLPIMPAARSRMTGAVLGNSFYVIGGRCPTVGVCDAFQGTNDNQKLLCLNTPTSVITGAGSVIQTEGCSPGNGVIDPGETLTISFCVQNTGNLATTNLVGTLQATGGVTSPSGPQTYGALPPGSPAVCRSFTFTAASTLSCGGTLAATIQFQDGATNLGNVTYNYSVGIASVTPPALPSGWTAAQGTNAGGFPLWVTSNSGTPAPPADSLPNSAFSPDPSNLLDNRLNTPSLMYTAGSQLTFRQNYDLEMQNATTAYDAGVLEITNDAGATWQDITAAGGTFVTGGYNHTFVSTGFMNPIAGARSSWSGISNAGAGGFETCTVGLPSSLAGQSVLFRWRMCSDNSVSHAGWRVDSIRITETGGNVTFRQDFEGFACCSSGAPQPLSAVSRKTHTGVGTFDVPLPLTAPPGIEPRTSGGTNDYTMVVTFGSPVTVNGTPQAQVIAGTATIGTGGVSNGGMVTISGNDVTVPLTNVTNAQTIQVRLNTVTGGSGSGNVTISMSILIGDVVANGAVNSADVAQTKARLGAVIDTTNFRSDINANGTINSGDVSLVKAALGTGLP